MDKIQTMKFSEVPLLCEFKFIKSLRYEKLEKDIEYYKSRIEELESENEQAKKIIREYSKWECEYCDYKRNPNYVTEHCSQCQKYSLHKKAEAFINKG